MNGISSFLLSKLSKIFRVKFNKYFSNVHYILGDDVKTVVNDRGLVGMHAAAVQVDGAT